MLKISNVLTRISYWTQPPNVPTIAMGNFTIPSSYSYIPFLLIYKFLIVYMSNASTIEYKYIHQPPFLSFLLHPQTSPSPSSPNNWDEPATICTSLPPPSSLPPHPNIFFFVSLPPLHRKDGTLRFQLASLLTRNLRLLFSPPLQPGVCSPPLGEPPPPSRPGEYRAGGRSPRRASSGDSVSPAGVPADEG